MKFYKPNPDPLKRWIGWIAYLVGVMFPLFAAFVHVNTAVALIVAFLIRVVRIDELQAWRRSIEVRRSDPNTPVSLWMMFKVSIFFLVVGNGILCALWEYAPPGPLRNHVLPGYFVLMLEIDVQSTFVIAMLTGIWLDVRKTSK